MKKAAVHLSVLAIASLSLSAFAKDQKDHKAACKKEAQEVCESFNANERKLSHDEFKKCVESEEENCLAGFPEN